jgi:hypothetical protein
MLSLRLTISPNLPTFWQRGPHLGREKFLTPQSGVGSQLKKRGWILEGKTSRLRGLVRSPPRFDLLWPNHQSRELSKVRMICRRGRLPRTLLPLLAALDPLQRRCSGPSRDVAVVVVVA